MNMEDIVKYFLGSFKCLLESNTLYADVSKNAGYKPCLLHKERKV